MEREVGALGHVEARVRDACVMEHKLRSALEFPHDPLDLAGQPHIVLIAQEDDVAGAAAQGALKICDNALAGALKVANLAVALDKGEDCGLGAAVGAVVGDYHFVVFAELTQDGGELLGDIFTAVVGGECDRDLHINRALRRRGCGYPPSAGGASPRPPPHGWR